jgi:hypothetical protein
MLITTFTLFLMAPDCSGLVDMKMPGVTITSAQSVEPGNSQFKIASGFSRCR